MYIMIDGIVSKVVYVQSKNSGHGLVSWSVKSPDGNVENHHAVLDQLKEVVAQAEAQRRRPLVVAL